MRDTLLEQAQAEWKRWEQLDRKQAEEEKEMFRKLKLHYILKNPELAQKCQRKIDALNKYITREYGDAGKDRGNKDSKRVVVRYP